MSDYGEYSDDDLDYDFLDDYSYVEEGFHIADELAERTVASPPPYDDEDSYLDWDRFDYYQDYEDGSLGYYDTLNRKSKALVDSKPEKQQKRKRNVGRDTSAKKKLGDGGKQVAAIERAVSPTPTVLWRTQRSRMEHTEKDIDLATQNPIALLKHWRKLPNVTFAGSGQAPFSGREAATLQGIEDVRPLSSAPDDATSDVVQIDEEALRAALTARLGDMGQSMEGFDADTLMHFAMRILGGEEDADDIAGELAEDLLDRDEDDPSAAGISSWLEKQKSGASLLDGQDRAEKVADDAVDEVQHSGREPDPPASSTASTSMSKKRKATVEPEVMDVPESKRTRGFDAPTNASKARAANSEVGKS